MTNENMLRECVTPNEDVIVMCATRYRQGKKEGRLEERERIINVIEEIKQSTFYCMGDLCDDTTLEGYHCANCALDYIIERLKEVKDYA